MTNYLYNTNPAAQPSASAKSSRVRLWLVAGLLTAVAVAVASVGAVVDGGQSAAGQILNEARLETAKDNCAGTVADIRLGDSGHSLTIDGAGLASGPPIERVACVLASLETPDSVIARIDATRALDGMQIAVWDQFTASWTYHPDNGLWMVIEQDR